MSWAQILGGTQGVGALGRHPELGRQPLGHDLAGVHRLHRRSARDITTLAFVAAAIVSALGIVGWIGMVPKLIPLQWNKAPAAAPAEA